MGFVSAKCPACAKDIEIPAEEAEFFCPYCGSKFLRDAAYAFAAMPEMSTGDADLSDFVIVGTTLAAYRGTKTHVIIPSNVTVIADEAFMGNKSISSITIPDSVTSIGAYCFNGCTSLATVAMSNRITTIGNRAFKECSSLTEINLPQSLEMLGTFSFQNCTSLTLALVPSNCTLGAHSFEGCPVKVIKR